MQNNATIVSFLSVLSRNGVALRRSDIVRVVRRAYGLGDGWDGWGWIRRFLQRNNAFLETRNGKGIKVARTDKSVCAAQARFLCVCACF